MTDPEATKLADVNLKESEVIDNGYNATAQKTYNYNRGVFLAIIGYIKTAALPFVAWTRMNHESTGADGRVPLHQAVTTDHTPQSVTLDHTVGYPLYESHPFSQFSKEYLRNGVNVGGVGFAREDGTFGFLFNACPPQNRLINPRNGLSLATPGHSETRAMKPLAHETCFLPPTVTITKSGEYIGKVSQGAIPEPAEGARQHESVQSGLLSGHAKPCGEEWYKYRMTQGKDTSNGSLSLLTSFTKCTQRSTFDRPFDPGQGLAFVSRPFGWKCSRAFTTEVANPNQGDTANQRVILRGYGNMIRQDIFGDLCAQQRAQRLRDGGGASFLSTMTTGRNPLKRTAMSTVKTLEEVVLHPNFNTSSVHPSDFIITALLSQLDLVAKYVKMKSKLNVDAKVALIHDDICDLLRRQFPKSYAILMNIARLCTITIDKFGYVSLEKLSDATKLQVSVLQRPLTTPYEDYTPVPATISLTLPRELVERILLLLDIVNILTCRLVNREFNKFIQSSISLQYFLACKAAGVIDNPRSSLSYAERLEALEKREDAWRKLNPVFEMTIEIKHPPSSISTYGLTGGAYFLKDNNQGDLHYCHLPSSRQESPRWIRIPGHGPGEGRPGIFVSFAIAVYEHNLIINVISSDIGNQAGMQRHSLDLVLLKFSTGEYHPLARQHRIHIQRSPSARPWVIPRIVGDHLALVVHSQIGASPDKLFIFDWKTGHKRLQHETTEDAYSDLVFVSPELLLVPNINLSHFEIWHLPPSHPDSKPPSQILALQIPAVSPGYSIFNLGCHGEPNPFLDSIPYFPPRPFFPSPESSIIIVNLIISSISPAVRRQRASYTLIMHRRALLDTIQKWTSPSLLEQIVLPTRLMHEVTVHKIADPDDGSVRLGVQSKLVSMMSHLRSSPTFATSQTSPTSTTSHISVGSGFSSGSPTFLSTSQYNFPQVQWADWGPPISRWFLVSETQARWITNSTGQKYAFSVPNDRKKLMFNVADFNPYNVRRNAETMARLRREGDNNSSNGNNEEGKEEGEGEWETLDHGGMFSEDVYMGLKCVVYPAPGEYDFDGVLMDEERLLGLKCNHGGRVESVKVLYFG